MYSFLFRAAFNKYEFTQKGFCHKFLTLTYRFTTAGTERWLESGRASIDMFHVARSPMQKYELRGDPLPRQVHYYRYAKLQSALYF